MSLINDTDSYIYIYTKNLKSSFNFPNLPKSCLWITSEYDKETLYTINKYRCDEKDIENFESIIQETLEQLRQKGSLERYKIIIQ